MTQTRQILKAMLEGARTSREIAETIGAARRNVSVALHRLSDRGVVVRAGVLNADRIGRPYVKWRLPRPASTLRVERNRSRAAIIE